jgi:hypothetical protein
LRSFKPAGRAQPKRLDHVCYEDGAGLTVVDVWEDEASFTAFDPVIGPALVQAGLNAPPEIHRLVGTISQSGTRTSYWRFDPAPRGATARVGRRPASG